MRTCTGRYRDAKTVVQLERRDIFRESVRFAGRAKGVLRVSLRVQSLAAHVTESNYFLRINKGCFAWADGRLAVDYASLRLSDGPVAPVAFGAPRLRDTTTVCVDYEKNPEHRAAGADDLVYLCAFCPERDEVLLSAPQYRRTRHLEMTLPDEWRRCEVHLYGFVRDNAGRTSVSDYLGNGVLEELADLEAGAAQYGDDVAGEQFQGNGQQYDAKEFAKHKDHLVAQPALQAFEQTYDKVVDDDVHKESEHDVHGVILGT